MRQQNPSSSPPGHFRRRARQVVGAVAITGAVLGGGLMATALPAFADVTTNNYTIGSPSGAVNSVAASPGAVGAGAATQFEVTFNLPVALSGTNSDWVTVTPSVALASSPTNVDLLGGSCIQAGTSGVGGAGSATTTTLTVELAQNCSFSAGQKVEVDFNADAPSSTGTFHLNVSTSKNTSPASSNTVTVATAGPQLTATTVAFGANSTYTIGDVPVASLSTNQTTLSLSVGVTSGTGAITFYNGAPGYTVTYTPSGGSATADPVGSVVLSSSGHVATLTLGSPLATGDIVNITARGTNPAAVASSANDIAVQPGNGAVETTTSITFGQSVTGASVVPSTLVAGVSANYVVSFKASDAVGAGGDIVFNEAAEQTNFATVIGIEVTDTTRAWHFVASGASLAAGSARIPLAQAVSSGDSLTVLLAGVVNPPAGTVSDFTVSTSSDSVPVDAPPYTIGASVGVNVAVNPSTAGALGTYTISDVFASAAMPAGSSIVIQAPAGTVFPNNPSEYSVEDSTTSLASGVVTAALSGGGSNGVTIKVPGSINAGDQLTLLVQDTINPSTASSSYTISLVGDVAGPSTAAAPFPHAQVSFPNGAIVSFSGVDYVLAGGHAFAVKSAKDLTALEKVDHAKPQSASAGAKPPSGAPRAGTLVFTRPVNGAAIVYVVGTDGELHGFATPKQFKTDGYDPALVVTVTSLAGVPVGKSAGALGAAGNARGTSSDGAIVDSSGTYYVFAGARAFRLSGATDLASLQKTDKAVVLSASVSAAQENAGIASGVELSAPGGVYASYQGKLYPFKSVGQLDSDGYGGTAAVHVPGTAGLTVAKYAGS
jgi:hypothetical protein